KYNAHDLGGARPVLTGPQFITEKAVQRDAVVCWRGAAAACPRAQPAPKCAPDAMSWRRSCLTYLSVGMSTKR
ncbi:hypothetical protein ACWDPI_35900, partial [Streptomyces zhihengii]